MRAGGCGRIEEGGGGCAVKEPTKGWALCKPKCAPQQVEAEPFVFGLSNQHLQDKSQPLCFFSRSQEMICSSRIVLSADGQSPKLEERLGLSAMTAGDHPKENEPLCPSLLKCQKAVTALC